ncbi:hypothetical protein OS493_038536, partial [Desmophyllum pertusum]
AVSCKTLSVVNECRLHTEQFSKWDKVTLEVIIENGKEQNEKLSLTGHCSMSYLPNPLVIQRANVKVDFNGVYKELIQNNSSLLIGQIKPVVIENQDANSGFLMSLSNGFDVIACIFL